MTCIPFLSCFSFCIAAFLQQELGRRKRKSVCRVAMGCPKLIVIDSRDAIEIVDGSL